MAETIIMPKLGNTVESVVILEWKVSVGDAVSAGDVLCEVETDKTTAEVPCETDGILLVQLVEVDGEVPVLSPFAIIGEAGEDVSGLVTEQTGAEEQGLVDSAPMEGQPQQAEITMDSVQKNDSTTVGVSPRARNTANKKGLDSLPEQGSGPGGRVIERDVLAALESSDVQSVQDVQRMQKTLTESQPITQKGKAEDRMGSEQLGPMESVPVTGIRKIIARRMHASLQNSAQLTLNSSAPAAALLAMRAGFKNSPPELEMQGITMNDMVMFAVSRCLGNHRSLNALFKDSVIERYHQVHLGFAVDTPGGLMVPVIRGAESLRLGELSREARRLSQACRDGTIRADEMSGGTFTVSNLGSLGVESFTPVLDTPQVGILGVGAVVNHVVEKPDFSLGLEKRMGLSLTIDHRAVDGAPGARFLQDLSVFLGNMEWAFAL